jgi:hypothetical protein
MGFCWSPDGKCIAHGWREQTPAPGQPTESHLVVADPDGSNSVTIATDGQHSRHAFATAILAAANCSSKGARAIS